MDRVKRHQKLELQRKLCRQSVKRNASSPVSCTSTSSEETKSENISQKGSDIVKDMQQLSVTNGVESSCKESHEMVTENERKSEEKPRVVLSVKTFSNCANDEETIAESSKSMTDGKPVVDFNGNVVESGSENTDFDGSVQSEHGMLEHSENTNSNHSVVKEKDDIVKSDGLTTSEVCHFTQ